MYNFFCFYFPLIPNQPKKSMTNHFLDLVVGFFVEEPREAKIEASLQYKFQCG